PARAVPLGREPRLLSHQGRHETARRDPRTAGNPFPAAHPALHVASRTPAAVSLAPAKSSVSQLCPARGSSRRASRQWPRLHCVVFRNTARSAWSAATGEKLGISSATAHLPPPEWRRQTRGRMSTWTVESDGLSRVPVSALLFGLPLPCPIPLKRSVTTARV